MKLPAQIIQILPDLAQQVIAVLNAENRVNMVKLT